MCKYLHMPTNLAIDDRLLTEALRIGKRKSKRETVNEALVEYIAHRKQRAILQLFGQLDWDPVYDYKAQRRRR